MSHTSDLEFSPLSDAFAQDPHPFYAALRAKEGLTYFEEFDVWLAARFDDVSEIVMSDTWSGPWSTSRAQKRSQNKTRRKLARHAASFPLRAVFPARQRRRRP
jgi:hypothetical protein